MANISDVIGSLMQSGMSSSSTRRVQNAFESGGRGSGDALSGLLEGLGGSLSQMLGRGGAGGIGGMLQDVLGNAGRAVGGGQNLAFGSLGALAGALLGGGGGAFKGALGGGAMALLGGLAHSALKGSSGRGPEVPLGLREPRTDADKRVLERDADLVLKAMINAAKADGHIDRSEVQRIAGQLEKSGIDQRTREYVMAEMQKPLDTEGLVAAAAGRSELAAQLYAASLLAIEVDTPAEKDYLDALASKLNLQVAAANRLEEMLGVKR